MSCANIQTHDKIAKKYAFDKQITEFKTICNYKAPLKQLTAAVEKAEKARKKNPSDSALSECYSSDRDLALETLQENGKAKDEKVADLEKRWKEVCGEES